MKKFFLLLLAASAAFAQEYVAHYTYTLAGTAAVFTVQQPAASAKTVRFIEAYISCSVDCTVSVERDGTAASSTSVTPTKMRSTYASATATAWRDSNVGAGTVLQPGVAIEASGGENWVVLGMNGIAMTGTGTGKNVTVKTNAITGTVRISVRWSEAQ